MEPNYLRGFSERCHNSRDVNTHLNMAHSPVKPRLLASVRFTEPIFCRNVRLEDGTWTTPKLEWIPTYAD